MSSLLSKHLLKDTEMVIFIDQYVIIIITRIGTYQGRQSKSESGKPRLSLGGLGGMLPQEILETAHSEMLSGGSFGLESCEKLKVLVS